MRAAIPPSWYVLESTFSQEQERLFSDCWQFVGMADDLNRPNDFIACQIGGRSVVIQNFDGELRAFENICRHRHSILQRARHGNRSLICPYHGWRYDKSGLACGIPARPRFDEKELDDNESQRLKSYAVEKCGKFVFVRVSASGPALEDFLGEAGDVLLRISAGIGERVDTLELNEVTNWKVAVENTLEFYHVNLVHRDSFAKLGAVEREHRFQGLHSQSLAAVTQEEDRRRRKLMEAVTARPFVCEEYLHQFVFPNLTVATTQGVSFSVQFFEPVVPGTTRFVSHVFATVTADSTQSATAGAIARQTAQFNRAVFLEDQAACELVQRGLRETIDERRGILSTEEGRVLAFQRIYMESMGELKA